MYNLVDKGIKSTFKIFPLQLLHNSKQSFKVNFRTNVGEATNYASRTTGATARLVSVLL